MLLVLFPLLPMAALLFAEPRHFISPAAPTTAATAPLSYRSATTAAQDKNNNSEEIVAYAMRLVGSPYVYAGISPEGFDCSGFVTHVFSLFDVTVPHSSALQAEEGTHVARENAQAGDLVIFTGTNPDVREPGHVGIVTSSPGDTIEFVHASSNGGVKVSKVEGTRYDLRFLQVRRVL